MKTISIQSGLALVALLMATPLVAEEEPRLLAWEDLLPEGTPEFVIDHSQPMDQVQRLFDDYQAASSGVVDELNNQNVKIPGFVVPLDINGSAVSSFLLVPYFGACIHLPPPPPNQIVYVTFEEPVELESIWEPFWVTGTMITETHRSNVGEASYTLRGEILEIYEY
ncbi:MAG: DUF3299 domain-containing protein [Pseudomonadota bacterium]